MLLSPCRGSFQAMNAIWALNGCLPAENADQCTSLLMSGPTSLFIVAATVLGFSFGVRALTEMKSNGVLKACIC